MKYYKKDRRVLSVMVEINRRLYLDSHGEITGGYQKIREAVGRVFTACMEDPALSPYYGTGLEYNEKV